MAGDGEMEDLVAAFGISSEPLSTDAPHPRFSQYKSRTYAEKSQSKRRDEFLESQKEKRRDQFMVARAIALEKADFDEGTPERKGRRHSGGPKHNHYKDQLMLSEWMVDKPEDFEENWIMVPSPEGRRSLVVASRGLTTAYNKAGWMLKQFQSWLPGGNVGSKNGYSLLDCIFSEVTGTFYVLDIMCWKQQPVFDSEAQFRFFWLQSKIAESPELMEKCPTSNPYRFEVLPSCNCDSASLKSAMEQEFPYKLDGLLFYHKEALYCRGERTPLVEWLKPFMLPEILGIPIPDKLSEGHQNESAAEFVENFNKKMDERIAKRGKAKDAPLKEGERMDADSQSVNNNEDV